MRIKPVQIILFSAILTIFCMAWGVPASADTWYTNYQKAMRMYMEDDYMGCIRYAEAAFASNPQSGPYSVNRKSRVLDYYPHWLLCRCYGALGYEADARCHCEGQTKDERFVGCMCQGTSVDQYGSEVEVVERFEFRSSSSSSEEGVDSSLVQIKGTGKKGGPGGDGYELSFSSSQDVVEPTETAEKTHFDAFSSATEDEPVKRDDRFELEYEVDDEVLFGTEDWGRYVVELVIDTEDGDDIPLLVTDPQPRYKRLKKIEGAGTLEADALAKAETDAKRAVDKASAIMKDIDEDSAPREEYKRGPDIVDIGTALGASYKGKALDQELPESQIVVEPPKIQESDNVSGVKAIGPNTPPEVKVKKPRYNETIYFQYGQKASIQFDVEAKDPDGKIVSIYIDNRPVCDSKCAGDLAARGTVCRRSCDGTFTFWEYYDRAGEYSAEITVMDDGGTRTTQVVRFKTAIY